MTKKIVFRVEDGMDRRDILATTYQMRNFYRQLGDGYFTALDVMNYIQHQQVMKWIPKNAAVLDMCCGRGLMLPLLRYHKKEIRQYVGIDIKASNATFLEKRVTNGKPIEEDYYPFPVEFVEGNVATMNEVLDLDWFDFIIYTASIEHMHPDAGQASLAAARECATDGAMMYVTGPNTPEGQDGYDTQYRAHVYEWKVSELEAGLRETGWEIVHKYSLLANKKDLKKAAKNRWLLELVEDLEKVIPNEWLIPVLAPAFPDIGKEMAILAKAV
jgi:SAM-dependent methyltransferase